MDKEEFLEKAVSQVAESLAGLAPRQTVSFLAFLDDVLQAYNHLRDSTGRFQAVLVPELEENSFVDALDCLPP